MKKVIFILAISLTTGTLRAQTTRTVTSSADSGPGSLREALTAAANDDQIVFAASLANQTIRLNSQLTLNKSVNIDGQAAPNLTLSGQNAVRILRIDYSFVTVSIKNLTFANGRAADNDPATKLRGGAIELLDPNTLRVENCRFLNNVGERSGALFVGYGARATVLGCTFDDNDGSVANDGFSAGAISTYGGGPAATVLPNGVGGKASLEVRDCKFRRNKGIVGGAVYVLLGALTVENSEFLQNTSSGAAAPFFRTGPMARSAKTRPAGRPSSAAALSTATARAAMGAGCFCGATRKTNT